MAQAIQCIKNPRVKPYKSMGSQSFQGSREVMGPLPANRSPPEHQSLPPSGREAIFPHTLKNITNRLQPPAKEDNRGKRGVNKSMAATTINRISLCRPMKPTRSTATDLPRPYYSSPYPKSGVTLREKSLPQPYRQ